MSLPALVNSCGLNKAKKMSIKISFVQCDLWGGGGGGRYE